MGGCQGDGGWVFCSLSAGAVVVFVVLRPASVAQPGTPSGGQSVQNPSGNCGIFTGVLDAGQPTAKKGYTNKGGGGCLKLGAGSHFLNKSFLNLVHGCIIIATDRILAWVPGLAAELLK